MIRLLLCLGVAVAAGVTLLLLRQQRLQLKYECNRLHAQILDTQRVLWRQQVQVAAGTAPAALEQVLEHYEQMPPVMPEDADVADPAGEWDDLPDAVNEAADDWSVFASANG